MEKINEKLINKLVNDYQKISDKDREEKYFSKERKIKSIKNKEELLEFLNNDSFSIEDSRRIMNKISNLSDADYNLYQKLIDESEELKTRWDLLDKIKGIGSSIKSEILFYLDPNKYIYVAGRSYNPLNKIANKTKGKYKSGFSFNQYKEILDIAQTMLKKLQERYPDANMYDINEILITYKDNDTEEENKKTLEKDTADTTQENKEPAFKAHNLIIYGVPGCGKSYYIKTKIGNQDKERVVFYPEYTYADFVGTYKLNEEGKITPSAGPFTRILDKALNNSKTNFYLIIEEMNRGNAEAIFGDIIQLLDRDSDGKSEYKITNDFISKCLQKEPNNSICLPSNLYLVATINTSDQNVFNLDTAFGRRWEYLRFNEDRSKASDTEGDFKNKYIKGFNKIKWNDFREKINDDILNSDKIWNKEDKLLGLFYINKDSLISPKDTTEIDNDAKETFINKVIRYLWFDVYTINNKEDLIKSLNNALNYEEQSFELKNEEITSFDKLSEKIMKIDK